MSKPQGKKTVLPIKCKIVVCIIYTTEGPGAYQLPWCNLLGVTLKKKIVI